MKNEIMKNININELFDSYDLFSSTGLKKIKNNTTSKYPNISEVEIKGIESYLLRVKEYSVTYGNKIAQKYGTPFLPRDEQAKEEINEYIRICKEKFAEIDEDKFESLFSIVCWLYNR